MKNGWVWKLMRIVLPPLVAALLRLWLGTCRIREHGLVHRDSALGMGCPLVCTTWHYAILAIVHYARIIPLALMVSSSNDGDLLSAMLKRLGFSVVRGSSHNKGMAAAKELIREMQATGKSSGLVADGSRGPARIAQAGPLMLAAKTGRVVVPAMWAASRYIAFNSWDRLMLPLPFSRIDIIYGEPLLLPEGLKAHQLEPYRLELEQRLNDLYRRVWAMHGQEKH